MQRTEGTSTAAAARNGRLLAQPHTPTERAPSGMHRVAVGEGREALLYVPPTYHLDSPAPLAVMLHGAGGTAEQGIALLRRFADHNGVLLLAPKSLRGTWDVIAGAYGPDIGALDRALEQTFAQYAVDPAHLAVGGFSDGASYALSVGRTNGALFSHIIAFSPGFMAPADDVGEPAIYISHGLHDQVLPIGACSRRIVPRLERDGREVLYREFDGPHTVPPAIAQEAVTWFVGR